MNALEQFYIEKKYSCREHEKIRRQFCASVGRCFVARGYVEYYENQTIVARTVGRIFEF